MTGRYKTYQEYTDSQVDWIGRIPNHWGVKRLKFIFDIKKRIAGQLGFDVLSITQKGIIVKDIESGDGQLSMDYSKYQLVFNGDFAMNHMDLLTGYVDISDFNGVTSPDYRVFTIKDKTQFFDRYYLYLLQMCYKQKIFFPLGQGSAHLGRWRLPTEAFNEVEYPHPDYSEQQKIASFLDHETTKIDTLITKQEKLIELLKEKRQAVISHAVTKGLNPDAPMKDSGVEWLGEVPKHWDIPRIKQIVDTPVTDGPHETPTFVDSGVPFVSAEAVSKGVVDFRKIRGFITEQQNAIYSAKYAPKIYDIYMVKSGATTGVTAIVETNKTFNIWSPLAVIRCKGTYHPYFVLNFMRSHEFLKAVELNWSFGTQQNIGMGVIENLHVACPPKDEAIQIANYLQNKMARFEILISKATKQIELMQERKTALISAAVTGKIDVRVWEAM